MTPEKCPGCGTKLSPEMLACPNCPMSFPEDDPSATGVNPLKQSPYWNFVLPALFFAALAAGIWYLGAGLFRLGEENAKTLDEKPNFLRSEAEQQRAADERAAGGGDDKAVFRPTSSGAGPSTGGAADAGDRTAVISITPVDQADQAAAPTPPPPPSEWKLRGSVYDLATLKPLSGCWVEFSDPRTNQRRKTRTNSSGQYRMILPPLDGGYAVTVSKAGYSPNYLDPATPGVRELGEADRRALGRSLAETLTSAPLTLSAPGAAPVVTDFYLAPRP